MSDHFSGPRALADPAADITDVYAFPSPERPGHLVLVMNVLPPGRRHRRCSPTRSATASASGPSRPSRPRLRSRSARTSTRSTSPSPLPSRATAAESWRRYGTCTTPSGQQVSFLVGDESAQAPGLRIFAGPRLDPFFIDFVRHIATEAQEKLAFRPAEGVNVLEGQNVLSIVVEFDTAVFCPGSGPLLAVVAETVTTGSPSARLERMGRPEIKNFILQPQKFDTVNRDLEIRDLYNAEDTFSLNPAYAGAYRARLNANLAYFDRLDGKIDWPPDDQGTHPLTELLLADFLVVDMSKPFSDEGYLEIETALLAGRQHTTCGGRSLNHDMVDIVLHAAGRRRRRSADQRRRRPGHPAGQP